jgi:hypothetical protein
VKPVEVQWRLLRAERRALDGPPFTSPAVNLARTLRRLRGLLIARDAPESHNPIPRIYHYAIDYCHESVNKLLPLVPVPQLAKALNKLANAQFRSDAQEQVINACWRIFERTHAQPESGLAVHREIQTMLRGKHPDAIPSQATVYGILNRLDLPTKQGKRGPQRGPRARKTSKKRA